MASCEPNGRYGADHVIETGSIETLSRSVACTSRLSATDRSIGFAFPAENCCPLYLNLAQHRVQMLVV